MSTRRVPIVSALLMRLPVAVAMLAGATLAAQEVRVTNTARFAGSGRFDWTVFLVADPRTLDDIASVEYSLHPTIPNPVRRVTDRRGGFQVKGSGRSEFTIPVKVVFKDGRTLSLEHRLTLQEMRPQDLAQLRVSQRDVRTRQAATRRSNDRWDWEIYLEADEAVLEDIRCVEYRLHPALPDPVRNICTRGPHPRKPFLLSSSGRGTFTIGVKVSYRDGTVQYLTHDLSFATARY